MRAKINPKIKRWSAQKERIEVYLQGTNDHPTAQQVYEAVHQQLPTLSVSTVYRDLQSLEEDGRVRSIVLQGRARRYESNAAEHPHYFCRCCNRLFNLTPEDVQLTVSGDWQPDEVSLLLEGICKECRKQKTQRDALTPIEM